MVSSSEPDARPGDAAGPAAPLDPELREDVAIRYVTQHLADDYADEHPAEEVEQVVEQTREQYADAPVRDFVPILVERDARKNLDEPE